ncbi:RNA recognition motif domain [Trinorchestia longiramus]|nr:RNA recognition motif domain [Trinorchestia longiramus]
MKAVYVVPVSSYRVCTVRHAMKAVYVVPFAIQLGAFRHSFVTVCDLRIQRFSSAWLVERLEVGILYFTLITNTMVMEAPTPICVGMEFVRQYYTILNKAPSLLHRFYAKNSSFMHGGDISNREPIIGQSDIHNYIKELNYKDCHAKILLIDSQATLGDGIVIQVTGELSNDGRPMRRFMQTFVLAPQSEKKYYVYNDIFRYQDQVFTSAASVDSSNDAEDDIEVTQQQDNGYVEEMQRQQEVGPTVPSEGLNVPLAVAPSGVGVSSQPVLGDYVATPVALHPQTAAPPTHPPGVHAVPTPQQPPVMVHSQQQPQQLNGSVVPGQDISAASVVPPPQQPQAPAPPVPAPQQQAYSHLPAQVAHHQHPATPQVPEVAASAPSQQPPAQSEMNDEDSEWGSSNTGSKWEDPVPPPPRPQPQQQPAVRVQPQQQQHHHHHQGRNTASVAPSTKVVEKKEDQAPLSYAAAANSMGGGIQQQQPMPSQYPSPPVASVTPAPSAPSQVASSQQSQPRDQQPSRQNSHPRDQQGQLPHHPRDRDHNGGFQKSGRGSRQPYRMRQSNYSESGEHSGADDHTNSSESSYSSSRYENRRRDDQSAVPDTQQIFVGNVPPTVTNEELRETFVKFGKILEVRINPGKSKVSAGPATNGKAPNSVPNIGFITFEEEESVRKVLNARPIKLGSNHRLNVEEKKNNRPRTNPRPPMGGRGSFNRMDGGRGPSGAGPRGGFSGPRRS